MGKLLWEILDRTMTGPIMDEQEFEIEFFPTKIAEIVARHKIERDPEDPIMSDPGMADEIFQAGLELLVEVGLYCKDTKRIVKFTEEEIREVIKTRKSEVTLGKDRDAITLKPRAPEDKQHPYTFFPAGNVTNDLNLYKQHCLIVAQEPTCDGLIPLPLTGIGDMSPASGTPSETLLLLAEAQIMNEVAAQVGRPGMFFGIPMSASSSIAFMTVFASGLYNKYNCCLPVQILQDMRINYDRLNLAYFAQLQGIVPWISSCPAMYAYLTGPEQAAVEIIAHTLGMMAYSDGSFTQGMTTTVDVRFTGPDIWWSNSAAALAAERNLKVPWVSMGSVAYGEGALIDAAWYGSAAQGITACISGMEGIWLSGEITGLGARWAGEIARAAAGIKVSDGIAIMKGLAKKYKEYEEPTYMPYPPSRPFGTTPLSELHDLKTLRPTKKYLDQYKKFTKIFKDMGLDYPTWD
jgi:methylamine--corrinoid protein Co-methyltransferase